MNNRLIYLPMLVIAFVFVSCSGEPPALTPEERYAVDTIYGSRFNELKAETDSLCQVMRDTMYVRLVDSLTNEYMKELEYLLKDKITEE
ncbi:MAG: hypothetical protein LC107_04200 [Chitinophagales bacterium]|nr:hypothetical protein [Chitinophagales bacterium]